MAVGMELCWMESISDTHVPAGEKVFLRKWLQVF